MTIMNAWQRKELPTISDADNLAVICIALMALCSSWWIQLFNLAMIILYGGVTWPTEADWKE